MSFLLGELLGRKIGISIYRDSKCRRLLYVLKHLSSLPLFPGRIQYRLLDVHDLLPTRSHLRGGQVRSG